MIRGHLATIKFVGGGDFMKGFEVYGQKIAGGPAKPKATTARRSRSTPTTTRCRGVGEDQARRHVLPVGELPRSASATRKRETLSTPELGAAAFSTVNMGVQSYRHGKVLFWDKEKRAPTEADARGRRSWEARSKKRGKPNQIIGWKAGDTGSLLQPPAYQKLEGPWIDGKDPAAERKAAPLAPALRGEGGVALSPPGEG